MVEKFTGLPGTELVPGAGQSRTTLCVHMSQGRWTGGQSLDKAAGARPGPHGV